MSANYTASEYREIKHPVTDKIIKGFFILEKGKIFQTIAYETKEKAENVAKAINVIRRVSS